MSSLRIVDTHEVTNNFLDDICSDTTILCENKSICSNSTQYGSIDNINNICTNIQSKNKCDDQVKECFVNANDFTSGGSGNPTKTSFVNIIIPIPNEFDDKGNKKYLRLPPLSASKNPNTNDVCDVCACIDRFGKVGNDDYTTGKGDTCTYDKFKYVYFPLIIENLNEKLKISSTIEGDTIINSNIIHTHTEENLIVSNLFDLLVSNGISVSNSMNFILKVLYSKNEDKKKQLFDYIVNKDKDLTSKENKGKFYQNISFFYIILISFILLLFFKLI